MAAQYIRRIDQHVASKPDGAAPIVNERELFLPDRIIQALPEKEICLEMEFLDGLATPPKGVPLEELLQFKDARAAEYEAFWDCLRDTAADIEFYNSESKRQILQKKLAKGLGEYEKAISESWGRRVANSAKFNFVVNGSLVHSFATAGAFWQYYGSNPIILAAGALGAVRFSLSYIANLKRLR